MNLTQFNYRTSAIAFEVGGKGYYGLGSGSESNNYVFRKDFWEISAVSATDAPTLDESAIAALPTAQYGLYQIHLNTDRFQTCSVEALNAMGIRLSYRTAVRDGDLIDLSGQPAGAVFLRMGVGGAARVQKVVLVNGK